MPSVSVIVPTYNRPDLLHRALWSLSRQDFKDFEAVVVNDAGEDVSWIVESFPFARLTGHATNKGLSASRNTGIRNAKGHYLAYLDDDDLWLPRHLEVVLEPLKKYRAAYSDTYHWIGERFLIKARTPGRNVACIINLVHERSVIDEMGGFDEDLREMEDWDFVIRMSRHLNGLWHVAQCTTIYSRRGDPGQLTSDRDKMQAAFEIIKERHGLTEARWQK